MSIELPLFPDDCMVQDLCYQYDTNLWACRLARKPGRTRGALIGRLVYGLGATPDLAVAAARFEWETPRAPKQSPRITDATQLLKDLGL